MIKPLNNMCLIEVIDEYDGIIRDSGNELVQKGILRDGTLVADHLTASAGYNLSGESLTAYGEMLRDMIGKTVYWEQYADTGKQFELEGKKYTLVPFYRLIGVDTDE